MRFKTKTKSSNNIKKFFHNWKLTTQEIAFMAILLALYTVIKYLTNLVLTGPLNISIELFFWIINGVLFTPLKGAFFSILCDTVFCFFTSGIAYWMIEYAIVAPIVSLVSSFFLKMYKEKNKSTIVFCISIILILIASTLIIFFIQLFNGKFNYEGVDSKKIFPLFIYLLISFLCFSMLAFLITALVLFKKNNNWKYIKWLHYLTLIILVIIIFRWLWGPYAYLQFSKRFYSKKIDFAKQYPISLFGIVTKSCLTIPIISSITIPMLSILERLKTSNHNKNRF